MSSAPKHSSASAKAYPAPKREEFNSGEDYAIACMNCHEARAEFDKPSDLTPKQERFAIESVKTGNASEAYKAAFNTEKMSANAIYVEASRLMGNPKISLRVNELRKQAADNAMMTKADVLMEAMRLARFDIRKLYDENGAPIPIHQLDDETAAAVQAVDVHEEYEGVGKERVFVGYTKKYKVADKNAALEKLFKHFGLYELDNSQKTDPIRDFLNKCSGKSLPIAGDND